MNAISPKQDFQNFQGVLVDDARKQTAQAWFLVSANFALAQLAWNGASSDELNGARKFLTILVNIGEPPVELPVFPKKQLDEEPPQ